MPRFNWEQLLQLAPLALMRPGSPEGAAMLQGYQQSLERMQGQQLEGREFARRERMDEATIANLMADNARASEEMELRRRGEARQQLQGSRDEGWGALQRLQQQPEAELPAGTEPLEAQNALVMDQLTSQQAFGVPSGTAQTPLPNMTALVSEGKKRRAAKRYAAFEKAYGEQTADAENSYTEQQGEFAGLTMRAVRELAETIAPARSKRTPATPGSFEEYVDLPPDQQAVRRLQRKAYQQADDRPRDPELAGLAAESARLRNELLAQGVQSGQGTRPSKGVEKRALNFFNRAQQASTDALTVEGEIAELGLPGQTRLQIAPNWLQSPSGKRYRQAQRAFTEARLRKDSGAAIPPFELENDARTYFVQPGDDAPTIAQKRAARSTVLASMAFESGPALDEFYGDEAEELRQTLRSGGTVPGADTGVEVWERDPATGRLVRQGAR